jgi:hypothetical protein
MSAKKVNPSNDDERVHLIALREEIQPPFGAVFFCASRTSSQQFLEARRIQWQAIAILKQFAPFSSTLKLLIFQGLIVS